MTRLAAAPLRHFVARLLISLVGFLVAAGQVGGLQNSKPAPRRSGKPEPKAKPSAARRAPLSPQLQAIRWKVLGTRPLGMYYYLDDARAFESLQANAGAITVLAPQSFWVDGEGFVHGGVPERVSEAARQARVPVMPLLINPGFDRGTASAFLRSPKAQERAVMYLAYLAKRDNFAGFQLDLENVDPADQALLTKFARLAAARLHREGRLLSVAVVPRFPAPAPGARENGNHSTGEWSAAYDYAALGQVADFLTLMAYDHSPRGGPPGPVAGYEWVRKALDYATKHVPPRKLLLGLPFYGREWTEPAAGVTTRGLGYEDIRPLLSRPEIEARWDERWRSPSIQFRDEDATRTVWYENARSLKEKLGLMREYRLRGFAAWRLGWEDPEFWRLAKEIRAPASASGTARNQEPRRKSRR